MKKVIAAAAGLMLVGTMVGSASAAVSFGGDARARGYYQTNYDLGATVTDEETGAVSRRNENNNFFNSRVRIQARAEAAGGAYAVGRALYGNGKWNGGDSGTADIGADKAYIGVPMGPTVLEAGRVPMNLLNNTKFLYEDVTSDGAQLKWKIGDANEIALMYIVDYDSAASGDLVNDDDIVQYGAYWQGGFAGGWLVKIGGLYIDNQLDDDLDGGAYGGLEFVGPAGPIALSGAFAADDRAEGDTGYGGFLQGGMDFGGTTAAVNVGFTKDGFLADGDFGLIMWGGGYSITALTVGETGDSWWIGVPVTFAVSEMLSLKAILAYVDLDDAGDAFEISGSAKYLISDGANFQFDIGYLGYSACDKIIEEESPCGMAGTFNVSF